MIKVLTIGCFDLLHKGHILHLVKARFEISKKLIIQDKQIYLIAAYVSQESQKIFIILMKKKEKENYNRQVWCKKLLFKEELLLYL